MHPIICKIGPVTIYSYGLALVVAFAAGSILARMQAKREGINPDIIFNFLFTAFIFGIIGGRLFYVIENIKYYLQKPLEMIMLQHGGLSWFGGLILGVISGALYLKNKKLAVYKILDLVSPFIALAQAIGRIGCFLNGCCFGKTVIPIQIYSSLVLVIIFIILRILQDRPHKEGQIFFTYLALYSLKRFFVEFWRLDNPVVLWGLTLFQAISIFLILFSIFKLIKCRNTP